MSFPSARSALLTALPLLVGLGGTVVAVGPERPSLNAIAEAYVRLGLAMGQHDPDFVDAYHGPAEWKEDAATAVVPLGEIRSRAQALLDALGTVPPDRVDEMLVLRHQYLRAQLRALVGRLDTLAGERLSFDEESRALYDAVAPSHVEQDFVPILGELETLLAGEGPLVDRYARFREAFTIPPERLDDVFKAAIRECRSRTRRHIELPARESFELEYVKGEPWGAYNWYQGDFKSLIQVNTDLPFSIDRALDLACHEGYPGHHVYNVLLEKHLLEERGFVEFSLYPLFSPQSLISEGTANYGIELAFPGETRLAYEAEVLFPLAGLDPSTAGRYARVRALADRLDYAGNEAARRFLDGRTNATGAIDWLSTYLLMPEPRAKQRLRFIERYRSYVINYNLGKDLVRQHIEARVGSDRSLARRWEEFRRLLASPRLPSGLK